MSQTEENKTCKLVIKNKVPGRITTGANVRLELDGVHLKNVTFLKLELKPNKVAKVTMEMVAEVDVDLDAVRVVGELSPIKIVNGYKVGE